MSKILRTYRAPLPHGGGDGCHVRAMIFPPYQLLIESYTTAREVESKHEVLDSQRS